MQFSVSGIEVGAGVFALVALAMFCWEFGRLWFAIRSQFWPYVLGTIEDVEIENRRDSEGDDFFVPRLRYAYRVGGESYVGKRLAFRPKGSHRREAVVAELGGIAAAKQHRVYFHPKHPRISVLKPGPRLINYFALLVIFTMMCIAYYVHMAAN